MVEGVGFWLGGQVGMPDLQSYLLVASSFQWFMTLEVRPPCRGRVWSRWHSLVGTWRWWWFRYDFRRHGVPSSIVPSLRDFVFPHLFDDVGQLSFCGFSRVVKVSFSTLW